MNNKNKKQITKTDKSALLAKLKKGNANITKLPSKKSKIIEAVTKVEKTKLLFSLDATASREDAWNIAKEITGQMYENIPENLSIGLAYHSAGKLQEITAFSDKDLIFKQKLNALRCQAGGTALLEILETAIEIKNLKAIVYIGDCFEENPELAIKIATKLKLRNTRLFIFHDKSSADDYDQTDANEIFPKIAKITGGAVLPFDTNSPQVIAQLLQAITVLAAKGIKALKASKNPQAQKLLMAVKE